MEEQNNLISHDVQNGEIQARLIHCAHCEGKGSCRSGKDGSSCERCARVNLSCKFIISFSKLRYGMVCSVCHGLGKAEPLTDRLHNRIVPALALFVVYFALIIIIWAACTGNKHFPELLAFSSTLIGSITGYYFGGKKK